MAAGGAGYYFYDKADKADRRDRLARLCEETTEALKRPSSNTDTFELQLDNALGSCSSACRFGDEPSCSQYDDHLEKLCGIDAGICENLCKKLEEGRPKEIACDHKDDEPKKSKKK